MKHFLPVLIASLTLAGCAKDGPEIQRPSTSESAPVAASAPPEWVLAYEENFEKSKLPRNVYWKENKLEEADPYSDDGEFFKKANPRFKAPFAYRISQPFSKNGWLTIESYTRDPETTFESMVSLSSDPLNRANNVLKITSPEHTDGTVVRPTNPLPSEYRVCVRAGFASFGTGKLINNEHNGYAGDETDEPWGSDSSTNENGFYWLAILDSVPMPRNNVWIHHHRKAVIDSDNNTYPSESSNGSWSNIWNGTEFEQSGEHPVMMFVLDPNAPASERTGRPFISLANGSWNSEAQDKQIRAADAYLDDTWYDVCIEKTKEHFRLTMAGDFRYGGKTVYDAAIDLAKTLNPEGTPDYFMFGDPHANYYEGSVYFDDIKLFVRP